jgi:hypothetical protein
MLFVRVLLIGILESSSDNFGCYGFDILFRGRSKYTHPLVESTGRVIVFNGKREATCVGVGNFLSNLFLSASKQTLSRSTLEENVFKGIKSSVI